MRARKQIELRRIQDRKRQDERESDFARERERARYAEVEEAAEKTREEEEAARKKAKEEVVAHCLYMLMYTVYIYGCTQCEFMDVHFLCLCRCIV